jgi:hypothetical protein
MQCAHCHVNTESRQEDARRTQSNPSNHWAVGYSYHLLHGCVQVHLVACKRHARNPGWLVLPSCDCDLVLLVLVTVCFHGGALFCFIATHTAPNSTCQQLSCLAHTCLPLLTQPNISCCLQWWRMTRVSSCGIPFLTAKSSSCYAQCFSPMLSAALPAFSTPCMPRRRQAQGNVMTELRYCFIALISSMVRQSCYETM